MDEQPRAAFPCSLAGSGKRLAGPRSPWPARRVRAGHSWQLAGISRSGARGRWYFLARGRWRSWYHFPRTTKSMWYQCLWYLIVQIGLESLGWTGMNEVPDSIDRELALFLRHCKHCHSPYYTCFARFKRVKVLSHVTCHEPKVNMTAYTTWR